MVAGEATRVGEESRRRLASFVPGPTILFLVAVSIFLLVGCLLSEKFAASTVTGLASGSAFASLAVALVLIYSATEVLNFAQGEMAMVTTYVLYQLNSIWGVTYWAAFFLTLGFAFIFGIFVHTFFIRPVQHKSIVATIIVTIGLFVLIDGIVQWIWGVDTKFMNAPFPTSGHEIGGVPISWQDVGTFATTVGAVIVLWLFFQFTKVGLAMRASALRPVPARLVGIRVDAMLALGWGLAAVLGAIAGVMVEAYQYQLTPTLMQGILLYSFVAAIVGGIESPIGALVGGLLFGVFLNLLGTYVDFISTPLQLPVALAVLLFVLLVKPSGLFGHAVVRKV